ncbi:hypothetical protein CL620_02160, partial [archaeon]|nr:hypothetical protein [archaeon]
VHGFDVLEPEQEAAVAEDRDNVGLIYPRVGNDYWDNINRLYLDFDLDGIEHENIQRAVLHTPITSVTHDNDVPYITHGVEDWENLTWDTQPAILSDQVIELEQDQAYHVFFDVTEIVQDGMSNFRLSKLDESVEGAGSFGTTELPNEFYWPRLYLYYQEDYEFDVNIQSVTAQRQEVEFLEWQTLTILIENTGELTLHPENYNFYRIIEGERTAIPLDIEIPPNTIAQVRMQFAVEEADGLGDHEIGYGIEALEPLVDTDESNNEKYVTITAIERENPVQVQQEPEQQEEPEPTPKLHAKVGDDRVKITSNIEQDTCEAKTIDPEGKKRSAICAFKNRPYTTSLPFILSGTWVYQMNINGEEYSTWFVIEGEKRTKDAVSTKEKGFTIEREKIEDSLGIYYRFTSTLDDDEYCKGMLRPPYESGLPLQDVDCATHSNPYKIDTRHLAPGSWEYVMHVKMGDFESRKSRHFFVEGEEVIEEIMPIQETGSKPAPVEEPIVVTEEPVIVRKPVLSWWDQLVLFLKKIVSNIRSMYA